MSVNDVYAIDLLFTLWRESVSAVGPLYLRPPERIMAHARCIVGMFLVALALTACGSSGGTAGPQAVVDSGARVGLEAPAHGSTQLNKNFSLTWHPTEEEDEEQWKITIYTEDDGTVQTVLTLTTTACSYRPLQLADNTAYTWKVEAIDDEGETVAVSETWGFQTYPTRMLPFAGALDQGSYPHGFTAFDDAVYFGAYAPASGWGLWEKREGSAAALVADLFEVEGSSNPKELTVCGERLYFSAHDGVGDRTLWVMERGGAPRKLGPDGGADGGGDDAAGESGEGGEGEIPGRNPTAMTAVDGVLYFSGNGTAAGETTLWRQPADGESVPEEVIRAGGGGPLRFPGVGVAQGGALYVSADFPGEGRELWRVDADGAHLLSINPGEASGDPKDLVAFGDSLFFRATGQGIGAELWTLDESGLPALVTDLNPGEASGAPGGLTVSGDLLFFAADSPEHGRELWRSDGTAKGTARVKDILEGALGSQPGELVASRGLVYFTAKTTEEGFELWKSDGSEGGTALVRDIRPGAAGSAIREMVPFGDGVMFRAEEGEAGKELWFSGGDANTTFRVKDIRAGEKGGYPDRLVSLGETLWFRADDGAGGVEPWQSDGTEEATCRTDNINPYVDPDVAGAVRVGEHIVMVATSGEHGRELFTFNTDGHVEVLADIFDGYRGSEPDHLFVSAGRLYFSAEDADHGRALWVSQGTRATTGLVSDGETGQVVSTPRCFTTFNGKVFFFARVADQWQLWETDGTPGGTGSVKDGGGDPVVVATAQQGVDVPLALAASETRLFFRKGQELWARDAQGALARVTGLRNPSSLFPVAASLLVGAEPEDGGGPATLHLVAPATVQAEELMCDSGHPLVKPRDFYSTGGVVYFSGCPDGQSEQYLCRLSASGGKVSIPEDASGHGLVAPAELCGEAGQLWLVAGPEGSRTIWQIPKGAETARPPDALISSQLTGDPGALRTVGDALYFIAPYPSTGESCLFMSRDASLGPVLDFSGRPLRHPKNAFVLGGFLFLTALNPDSSGPKPAQGFWVTSP